MARLSSVSAMVALSLILVACSKQDDDCPGGNWRADPTTGECPRPAESAPGPAEPTKGDGRRDDDRGRGGGKPPPAETRLNFACTSLPAPIHAGVSGVVTFPPLPSGFRVRLAHWVINYQVGLVGTPANAVLTATAGGISRVLFCTDAAGVPASRCVTTGDLYAPAYGDVTLAVTATLNPGEDVVVTPMASTVEAWGVPE